MTEEIPGFDRDPELDELLTSDLAELDEETRTDLQRYKARLLKARRDADRSTARPPWWGDSPAPETLSGANFSGVDMDAALEEVEAAAETEQKAEETSEEEPEDVEEPAAEEPEESAPEEPAEEAPEESPEPEEVEISDEDLVEVGFEVDPDLEELIDQDVHEIESEEKRSEVQLYKSRKMQARQQLRNQRTGGGGSGDGTDGESSGDGAERDGESRKAPPPEDVSQYRGERKIADLVSDRTSGREVTRRGFLSKMALGWAGFASMFALTGAATGRYFFPNVLANPPEEFVAGRAEDYPSGTVSEDFISQYRVWIVNLNNRLVSILAICTHLGCTPSWFEGQQIYKCPCHGSGYRKNGVNFEGPAPRPMDRVAVRLTPQGTLVVNKARIFSQQGTPGWEHEDAYIPLS